MEELNQNFGVLKTPLHSSKLLKTPKKLCLCRFYLSIIKLAWLEAYQFP